MDFSRLPDMAFLKLFEYLSLEDRIRAGRVNKAFRRIAQLSISRTKSLDLSEKRFRNLTPDQLAAILDLCSSSLERIELPSGGYDFLDRHGRQLTTRFANYECPRLLDISLGNAPIDIAIFERLIRNNLSIESLVVWHANFLGFPEITINSLKKLNLHIYNNAVYQSLIGRFPNLKELSLFVGGQHDHVTRQWLVIDANVLNEFFGSVPQVSQVSLYVNDATAIMGYIETDSANFWNLPLTSLRLTVPNGNYGADNILKKLAPSFRHLRELHLLIREPSNAGIAALAYLQELEILTLNIQDDDDDDDGEDQFDQGIRQLAHCTKLQKLDIFTVHKSAVSGGTLVSSSKLSAVGTCRRLGYYPSG